MTDACAAGERNQPSIRRSTSYELNDLPGWRRFPPRSSSGSSHWAGIALTPCIAPSRSPTIQPHLARRQRAVLGVVFDVRAFGQQPVDAAVLLQQVGQFRLRQAAHGVGQRLGRQCGVQPRHGGSESRLEHHFIVGRPLRLLAVGADDVIRGTGEA